jgi:hypothetical protein
LDLALTFLQVNSNQFKSLPAELGQLTNLEELYVRSLDIMRLDLCDLRLTSPAGQ